jgi:superfamily II DNA or RNA helicase
MVQMSRGLELVNGAQARAAIAQLILESNTDQRLLGSIELQPHQVSAVARLRKAIREFGGALLCDPVGTGKTFTALALADHDEQTLVVAPAVLKEMWEQAATLGERNIAFLSFESLSRRRAYDGNFDLLIVDEAHHARNPATQRYEMLSRLVSRSKVILLSATPVHNRRRDLEALLALFMGSRARLLKSAEVSRCVIRREARIEAPIPRTEPITWFSISEQRDIVEMLLALPPPVPPRDGEKGGVLIVNSLVRQWASSDAALRAALRRRLVRAESLIAALEGGRWPSKSELMAWVVDDETIQLSFAELLSPAIANAQELLCSVRLHTQAVRQVLETTIDADADNERADIIRRIRELHPDRRIVAFSQYADTVDRLFSLLSHDGGIAALTGSGARVAGGNISRAEALGRFAPVASGRPRARPANDVSLLLATDLLSEGVNLQDAGIVIHLDLPWTPARVEQRLGRIARLGSPHEAVLSFAVRPHVAADHAIRIEAILRHKESAATGARRDTVLAESIRATLKSWLKAVLVSHSRAVVTALSADINGFVAVCRVDGSNLLAVSRDGHISDAAEDIARSLINCGGEECATIPSDIGAEIDRIEHWLESRHAVGKGSPSRSAIRRIDSAVRNARPHERARINELAKRARTTALGNAGLFLESELDRLALEKISDADFLNRVAALASPSARISAELASRGDSEPVRALILLRKNNALMPAKER